MIDLRDLVLWWWPWRLALLLPAAMAGWIVGWNEERQFQPVYTAEAWVYVRDWRTQLQAIADKHFAAYATAEDRVRVALVIPIEAPAALGQDQSGIKLKAEAPSRTGALDAVASQISRLADVFDARDKDLAPYVAYLRDAGIPEISLVRPRRLEVMSPPAIVAVTSTQPLRWLYAFFAVAATGVAGSLYWLVRNEGRKPVDLAALDHG